MSGFTKAFVICATLAWAPGWAFLAPTAAQQTGKADQQTNEFEGEAQSGHVFQRDIGRGLIFRLEPTPGDEQSGWNIQICPAQSGSAAESPDYSGIATPPYHFQNPLYLDTSYATKAADAVRQTPRRFHFVMNAADYKAAENAVNLTIYANHASEAELKAMRTAAANIHLGAGRFDVLDSRVTPPKGAEDLGKIEWVKFRVTLKFDTDTTLAKILDFDTAKATN